MGLQNDRTIGRVDGSTIVLAAHYGSCHDLIGPMMSWGTRPPDVLVYPSSSEIAHSVRSDSEREHGCRSEKSTLTI
ncbi:hypothetical protein DL765_011199 [Monosporascus sp. GIB2]|nr:hypothetical protein DL765_011199 [Monosporascus sp. GIB2]